MGYPAKVQRNQKILQFHSKGIGYKNLAKMFNIDWSRVRQIIKENQKVEGYTQPKG